MRIDFMRYLIPIDGYDYAMEADDITGQVSNEVRGAIGEAPSTDSGRSGQNQDDGQEEDIEKIDDIFGTEEAKQKQAADGPSGVPEDDSQASADTTDQNLGGDAGADEGNPDDQAATDPNLDPNNADNGMGDNGLEDESNPDLAFEDKNRVRDNLITLYTVICGDIETITNSLTFVDNAQTIQVLNTVLNHLRNTKDYIYKTLTQNLTGLDYDELLQRYVTLKRVYDVCGEMIKHYFKNNGKQKVNVQETLKHGRQESKDTIKFFPKNSGPQV